MSNQIPERLQDMIEELRKNGINVTVAQVAAGQDNIDPEHSPLAKVMYQALNAMGQHNFDEHRLCKTMNAMQVIGFMVTEGRSIMETIDHLVNVHGMPEAAEWIVSTFKLLTALDWTIRESERDTGNAFNFSNDDPESDSTMAENIRKAEANLAELRTKAAPLH